MLYGLNCRFSLRKRFPAIESQDRSNLGGKPSLCVPGLRTDRKVISLDAAVSLRSSVKSSSAMLSQRGLMNKVT